MDKTILHKYRAVGLILMVGCVAMVVSSCKSDDSSLSDTQQRLAINVGMDNSAWETHGMSDGVSKQIVSRNIVDFGRDMELVVESKPREYVQREMPITRGTPITTVSALTSIGISIFNSSKSNYQETTPLLSTLSSTYADGAWETERIFPLNLSNTYSYLAYSPAVNADNGLTLEPQGRLLKYTAPTNVTLQPDLCWAKPVMNTNNQIVNFNMQHRLTAVGVKVSADNITIKKIAFSNVLTSGTLNLNTGVWSGLGALMSMEPVLISNTPSTSAEMTDITDANGYLMLPPQTFTNDNATLMITYQYNDESDEQTSTYKLKSLNGGQWSAGQFITYNIKFKANFSLTITTPSDNVPKTGDTYTFAYQTNSPNVNDPQASTDEPWISNLVVTRDSGSGSVKFDYLENPNSITRRGVINVTSGFTTTKFTLVQLPLLAISVSPANAGVASVPKAGATYKTSVDVNIGVPWKVTATNCNVVPSEGVGPMAEVKITIDKNETSSTRTATAKFATYATSAQKTITNVDASWTNLQD